MTYDRPARGMTLVELLIAMALSGFLMALLTNVLQSVQTGWKKTELAVLASDDHLAGVQYLFSTLSGVLAPDPRDRTTAFHGTRDRIEFLSAPSEAETYRGLVKARLYVTQGAQGKKALVAEMESLRRERSVNTIGSKMVLTVLDDVEAIAFSFSDIQNGHMQEVESWSEPVRLPKLVRIDLIFANKNVKPLQLMIAPRRNASGRCVFDLVSLSCRS